MVLQKHKSIRLALYNLNFDENCRNKTIIKAFKFNMSKYLDIS